MKIEDFSYSYQDGLDRRVIFNNVNLSFLENTFYTITGDSGSGKTTLLYCLSGIDENYEGKILFEEKDIRQSGIDEFRKQKVTMVFQNYNLIPYLNALENIELAMTIRKQEHKFNEDEILSLLDTIGIDKIKAKRKIKNLSGGEQQRVAIARALSSPAKLIIADEPTGNLDIHNSQAIIDIFRKLVTSYNKTVIMVTHNKEIAEKSDIEYKINQQEKNIKK